MYIYIHVCIYIYTYTHLCVRVCAVMVLGPFGYVFRNGAPMWRLGTLEKDRIQHHAQQEACDSGLFQKGAQADGPKGKRKASGLQRTAILNTSHMELPE